MLSNLSNSDGSQQTINAELWQCKRLQRISQILIPNLPNTTKSLKRMKLKTITCAMAGKTWTSPLWLHMSYSLQTCDFNSCTLRPVSFIVIPGIGVGFEVFYVQRKGVKINSACLNSVAGLSFAEDHLPAVRHLACNWWLERKTH